jgi:hypothetical protein
MLAPVNLSQSPISTARAKPVSVSIPHATTLRACTSSPTLLRSESTGPPAHVGTTGQAAPDRQPTTTCERGPAPQPAPTYRLERLCTFAIASARRGRRPQCPARTGGLSPAPGHTAATAIDALPFDVREAVNLWTTGLLDRPPRVGRWIPFPIPPVPARRPRGPTPPAQGRAHGRRRRLPCHLVTSAPRLFSGHDRRVGKRSPDRPRFEALYAAVERHRRQSNPQPLGGHKTNEVDYEVHRHWPRPHPGFHSIMIANVDPAPLLPCTGFGSHACVNDPSFHSLRVR